MPLEVVVTFEGLYWRGRGSARLPGLKRASSREEPGKDGAGTGQNRILANAPVSELMVQWDAGNSGGIVQEAVHHAVRAERECFRGC